MKTITKRSAALGISIGLHGLVLAGAGHFPEGGLDWFGGQYAPDEVLCVCMLSVAPIGYVYIPASASYPAHLEAACQPKKNHEPDEPPGCAGDAT